LFSRIFCKKTHKLYSVNLDRTKAIPYCRCDMTDDNTPPMSQRDFHEKIAALKGQRLYAEADAVALAAQENFPGTVAWAIERAWIAYDHGDFAGSIDIWREIRAKSENAPVAYFIGEGTACHRAGRLKEAEAVYLEALERFPNQRDVLIGLAWNMEAQGRRAEAVEHWRKVITHFPDVPEAYRRMAACLVDGGLREEAEAILQEGMLKLKDHADLYTDYAWHAEWRGDRSEALKRWEVVKTLFPNRPEGYWATAKTLMDLGRLEDAEVLLAPSLRLFPDNRYVLEINGWLATRQRSVQKADEIWCDFRARFPHEMAGYLGWISLLRTEGRLTEAEAMLAAADAQFPNNKNILVEWAQVLSDRQDWSQALARWRIAWQTFPDAPEAFLGLVRTSISMGRGDEAKAVFVDAEAKFEKSFDFEMNSLEVAAGIFDKDTLLARGADLVERFRERHEAYIVFSRLLRKFGELEQSASLLQEALKQFPEIQDLQIQYAQTLSEKRDWKTALPLWAALKKKSPGNGVLRDLVATYLWQARQDHSLIFLSGSADTDLFEIPSELEDVSAADGQEDLRDLFMQFESLGITCEFGMVQRRYGAEPLSLLRWTTAEPEELTAAIAHGLEGVGEPEHTIVEVTNGEYTTRDARYYLFSHTFTMAAAEPFDEFSQQQCKRLQFLRRKFVDDLKGAKKIYVYVAEPMATLSDEQIFGLYDAMKSHSADVKLLCVRPQSELRTCGDIDRIKDGLFFGYIDKVSTVDISFDHWIPLCRKLIAAIAEQQSA